MRWIPRFITARSWRSWYAWRPVYIDGEMVWLERIERRWEPCVYPAGGIWRYRYMAAPK